MRTRITAIFFYRFLFFFYFSFIKSFIICSIRRIFCFDICAVKAQQLWRTCRCLFTLNGNVLKLNWLIYPTPVWLDITVWNSRIILIDPAENEWTHKTAKQTRGHEITHNIVKHHFHFKAIPIYIKLCIVVGMYAHCTHRHMRCIALCSHDFHEVKNDEKLVFASARSEIQNTIKLACIRWTTAHWPVPRRPFIRFVSNESDVSTHADKLTKPSDRLAVMANVYQYELNKC